MLATHSHRREVSPSRSCLHPCAFQQSCLDAVSCHQSTAHRNDACPRYDGWLREPQQMLREAIDRRFRHSTHMFLWKQRICGPIGPYQVASAPRRGGIGACTEEMLSAEIGNRINRLTILEYFEVQMRPGGSAGRTHLRDVLAFFHFVTH